MVAIREFETQPADLFSETLQSLKRRLSLFVWQGFFESLTFVSLENDVLSIAAPSLFHKDWVQNHYLVDLQESASRTFGYALKVRLLENPEERKQEPPARFIPEAATSRPASITPLRAFQQTPADAPQGPIVLESAFLNPANTFEAFVSGPSNNVGLAACRAVAEQPGAQYSPLFLFGPVGIGKTHLLQAIGLYALKNNPKTRILYMSAEQWVNAYIQAIREKRFDAFRKKFRSDCDILLIDDIQFLAGKDASQDEFFHTFNSLHQAHKQIVVTSDKYPHEIQGLEDRLQTRLSWGLIADIRPPELDTRILILQKKSTTCGFNFSQDIIEYLAKQPMTSVRELEGALVRLSASFAVTKSPVTLNAVKEYLSPVFRRTSGKVTADRVCDCVAVEWGLKPLEIRGQSRQRQVATARQVAMALCRNVMSSSLPEIGRYFGGRDHSTVLSSIRKIARVRTENVSLNSAFERLEKGLIESE